MVPVVHVIDPLSDPRWDDLLDRHPRASVFHTRGWLEALKRTYGYEPFALTTTAAGPLENGLPVCRVHTWTARRLVSLPFSDHCEPLVDRAEDLQAIVAHLSAEAREGHWRSVELRPRHSGGASGVAWPVSRGDEGRSSRFVLHALELSKPAAEIFAGFHHSSTQRAIRRAEREGLEYEAGRSDRVMSDFYRLLRLTRRRHGLPPQPMAWFRSLAACLGDRLTIHLARKDGRAVAAIMTLSFRQTMVYKYGGSDAARHSLGGMPFLFWRAIQEAQAAGARQLDLGRSDLDQPGLIAFKDHLGAERADLDYCRWSESSAGPNTRGSGGAGTGRIPGLLSRVARTVLPRLPDAVLDWIGRLLYRHLG